VKIYFFRHGTALSRSEWDGPDDARPLTGDGAAVVRAVSERIEGMRLPIDAILSSPYARAWGTAEILEEVLGSPGLLHAERALEPGRFTLDSFEKMRAAHEGAAGLVLIGHEPSMTAVISELIGGGDLVLKKAGLARVDLTSNRMPRGTLRWLFPPKLL
jgi:phosphohistidine phosphatase